MGRPWKKFVGLGVACFLLLASCGASGSPPDTDGTWFLWLPDEQAEVDDVFIYHDVHMRTLFLVARGGKPIERSEEYRTPSLTMVLNVAGGDAPGITSMRVLLNCGDLAWFYETYVWDRGNEKTPT